jgi:hypothetical protein
LSEKNTPEKTGAQKREESNAKERWQSPMVEGERIKVQIGKISWKSGRRDGEVRKR